jgi:hypothetical protein
VRVESLEQKNSVVTNTNYKDMQAVPLMLDVIISTISDMMKTYHKSNPIPMNGINLYTAISK